MDKIDVYKRQIDESVRSLLQPLFFHEPFFVQFFSRTQSRAYNIDIDIGFESRKFDKVIRCLLYTSFYTGADGEKTDSHSPARTRNFDRLSRVGTQHAGGTG